MSVVFRADGLPPTSRVDYWREIISDVFLPLDLRGQIGPKTPAELRVPRRIRGPAGRVPDPFGDAGRPVHRPATRVHRPVTARAPGLAEYGYMSYADPLDALLLPPGHGEGLWHLDTLWTFKIPAAASGGAFSLAEQLIPKGSAPPVPPPQQPDLDRLLAGMREHGIEFLAPPPAR